MSRFWSPLIHGLEPYVPGEQPKVTNLIKLNTNESPYGPGDEVLAALSGSVNDDLRLYPDPNADALKQRIATYHNIKADQVFVGNGSDEVLAHIFHGFFSGMGTLYFPDITYSFYPVYCGLYGIDFELVPLIETFEIDLSVLAATDGNIIFPNPNAPTGIGISVDDVRNLVNSKPDRLVVVDEAYVDFGGESAIALVDDCPNLIVTQTLSKSRALAGMRLGFAVAQSALIDGLERIKNSFNSYPIDRLALAAACASFEDESHFAASVAKVISTRERLIAALSNLGFEVLPSQANFIFARHPHQSAKAIYDSLRAANIIVRHFNKPRIDEYLRISVGTDAEIDALITHLQKR